MTLSPTTEFSEIQKDFLDAYLEHSEKRGSIEYTRVNTRVESKGCGEVRAQLLFEDGYNAIADARFSPERFLGLVQEIQAETDADSSAYIQSLKDTARFAAGEIEKDDITTMD